MNDRFSLLLCACFFVLTILGCALFTSAQINQDQLDSITHSAEIIKYSNADSLLSKDQLEALEKDIYMTDVKFLEWCKLLEE